MKQVTLNRIEALIDRINNPPACYKEEFEKYLEFALVHAERYGHTEVLEALRKLESEYREQKPPVFASMRDDISAIIFGLTHMKES